MRHPAQRPVTACPGPTGPAMPRVFDLGDRERLPGRFHGARHGVRAQR